MINFSKSIHNRKWIIMLVLLVSVLMAIFIFFNRTHPKITTDDQVRTPLLNTNSPNITDNTIPAVDEVNTPIPQTLSLKVPFTPQAPTANWDELHNEACEEASAIMANAYFNQISSLPPATVEHEINKLIDWQQQNFGYNLSINTTETTRMIEAVYGLKTELKPISEQIIKQALANGKLVLLPANGQMLENPYFKSPGPIYHMLVITGFNENKLITNDPGTKRGQNYQYDYNILENATGNWDSATHEVNLSEKRIIIVSK